MEITAIDDGWVTVVASAQGIDVSNYQGYPNWATLGKGLSFAFAKATEGTTYKDPTFAHNWAGMKTLGLHRGAYHFFHPAQDPTAQAQYFVDTVKAQGIEDGDMLAADIEVSDGESDGTVNSRGKAFVDKVYDLVKPHSPVIVYANLDFAAKLTSLTWYALWIAYPSDTAPSSVHPWGNWTFWQWGTNSEGIDADAFNGTAEKLQSWLNSYV